MFKKIEGDCKSCGAMEPARYYEKHGLWSCDCKHKIEKNIVDKTLKEHLGDKAATLVSSMVAGTPSLGQLIAFRKKAACIPRLFQNPDIIISTLRCFPQQRRALCVVARSH